ALSSAKLMVILPPLHSENLSLVQGIIIPEILRSDSKTSCDVDFLSANKKRLTHTKGTATQRRRGAEKRREKQQLFLVVAVLCVSLHLCASALGSCPCDFAALRAIFFY
ncbi:MAG: hypothetical protein M3Q45_06825, partial [Chloroflexota bacterium]|nr:hypothetical protein [Chloroflexota bacterium]